MIAADVWCDSAGFIVRNCRSFEGLYTNCQRIEAANRKYRRDSIHEVIQLNDKIHHSQKDL